MKKTDNREKAVALRYQEKKDDAPRVVATGKGLIARKIKEIALANGVPIYQDNDLVELLAQIDIDREIPPELYAAVAEILSWIYKANKEMRKETIPGM
ncbi:MAG: flagellar biosynthesis protein FlhB [Fibrobacter sp.]|jgi:flagellar biosynthesis protein|nr:flagellar biosynthesis protein FlhB [Fibrobacter sp.]